MSFAISTDSGSNMPIDLIRENSLIVIPLTYRYDDEDHSTIDLSEFDGESYYEMIKNKEVTTSTVNIQQFIDAWEPYLKEGKDILHISMSSGISSTYQTSRMASEIASHILSGCPSVTDSEVNSLFSMSSPLLEFYFTVTFCS